MVVGYESQLNKFKEVFVCTRGITSDYLIEVYDLFISFELDILIYVYCKNKHFCVNFINVI